jgi:hypothetical protein
VLLAALLLIVQVDLITIRWTVATGVILPMGL